MRNGTIYSRPHLRSATTYQSVYTHACPTYTPEADNGFLDPSEDAKYNVDPKIINRRGVYKDVFGSGAGREWSDYQFRSNFPIAMVVAPELFDETHALGALQLADKVLRSPLGMKTLDPRDMQYRPYYANSNDSTDAAIAKGLNYHNVRNLHWLLYIYFLHGVSSYRVLNGVGRWAISCKHISISTPELEEAKKCVIVLSHDDTIITNGVCPL
jgi:glycogen debranching enzyme